jgi:capsid protein
MTPKARLDRDSVPLRESYDFYYGVNNAVWNPFDELFDPAGGDRWLPLYAPANRNTADTWIFQSESGLSIARMMCRYLATENPFAVNILENRVSYVVGTGMQFQVVPKASVDPASLPPGFRDAVQEYLDDELERMGFGDIQQEAVRRGDRDGEGFLRKFWDGDQLHLRFVDPGDVTESAGAAGRKDSFGIRSSREDVLSVEGYLIREEGFVPAQEMVHWKLNVDQNVKRGVPTLWPVRAHIHRAQRLLKNLSMLGQGRSSIAYIRKHLAGTSAGIRTFADERADGSVTDPATQKTKSIGRADPTKILDLGPNMEIEMPGENFNSVQFVQIVQAELRAAAARLVMPEYMTTSDASNGNYASLLVAEGPPYKNFLRVQTTYRRIFTPIVQEILERGVEAGKLPKEAVELLKLKAVPPIITTREPLPNSSGGLALSVCNK